MTLRISGKHMDIGDAFRIRIEERIAETVRKYFDGGYSGKITVEKAGSRFVADCIVNLDSGVILQATGEAQDPQLAFEAAAERIEKRLRRYKRRLKSHQATASNGVFDDVSYRVVAAIPDEEEEFPEDFAPTIVAETSVALRSMSVASAVVQLDLKDSPVFVFRNAGNEQVNIVYRRPDGNIGWIDPSIVKGHAAPRS
ncbi:MAG: ribosome hibernation-promoting factor, HPF/YfiA family [Phyllobacterium sp.]